MMFDTVRVQERINKVLRGKVFFIVGTPKSGTTWLQNILNGHPNVLCPGESNFNMIARFLVKMADNYNRDIININDKYIGHSNGYALFANDDVNYLFVSAIALLFSNLHGDSKIEVVGTKNPDYMTAMETTVDLLPDLKYVHIIRDGRDVSVSAWFHNLRVNPTGLKQRFSHFQNYVESIAQSWASDVQKARSFGRSYPKQYFELHYEDLHRDPELVIQRLLEFLCVDYSQRMVDQCRQSGLFEKLSKGRKRGQENRSSFFRKGIIGDWKNHFNQECIDTFIQYGGDLLREMGYEW